MATQRRKVTDYTPDPANANKGTKRGLFMVEESLRETGAGRSILVDRNRKIIAGNKTQQSAVDIGIEDAIEVEVDGNTLVVVVRKDLDLDTDERARKLAYYDNRASQVGLDWDAGQLLADLEAGLDLTAMFTGDELADIVGDELVGDLPDVDGWLKEMLAEQELAAGDFLFPTNNEWGVPLLDIKLQANAVDMPVTKWGTMSRTGKMPGTWHFYTEDYKFNGLWQTPEKVLQTGCVNVVEPNFSTNEQMPLAVALWGVYRKRWLARYFQMHGVRVFVDVNVAQQAREINKFGVPDGWKSYFTRAYSDKPEWLEGGFEDACDMRGDDDVLFVVYGGNQAIRDLAGERGWVWLPEDADTKMSSGRFLEDG